MDEDMPKHSMMSPFTMPFNDITFLYSEGRLQRRKLLMHGSGCQGKHISKER